MRFSSALSTAADLEMACAEAATAARLELASDQPPDLCVVFVSPRYGELDAVPVLLGDQLEPRCLVGCCGDGIVGAGDEVEGRPAVSVTLAALPGVEVRAAHLQDPDLPDDDGPPGPWTELVGQPASGTAAARGFIVLPDPLTFAVPRLLAGLDFAHPGMPVVGGLASGSRQPGGHSLFCGRSTHHSGCVLLSVGGAVAMRALVAQGCRPFGAVGHITRAHDYHLHEIDNVPALRFAQAQLAELERADLDLLRRNPLFLGIAMDPFATEAPAAGDFLIRNVMDFDQESGSMVIGETLPVGRAVQFHLRDGKASDQDLRAVLQRQRAGTAAVDRGALLFSCLGRGKHLYGEEGHDSRVFAEILGGEIPLGGFFCNGEIGPVQGTTYLHGFTSSFAVFGEPAP